jgi:polyisoprenoid-binding protein YceI
MHNYLALKQKPEENTMSTTQITAIPTGTWNVDPSHSSVEFRVKHLGISTVKGQFKEFEGTLEIGQDITASKATGKINAASIDTGEPKRDEHLRSADFFDVENYPYITFESTNIEVIDEDEFHVTGDLTMHGITKPITLHAEITGTEEDPWGNTRVGLEVQGELSRGDWGMSFNQALGSGNMLVSDKVRIAADISAVKAS